MKGKSVVHSSASDEWTTPKAFYDALDAKWRFNLDPCTTEKNPLGCETFYTQKTDGLSQSWGGSRAFVNPPYSNVGEWIEKCASHKTNALIVALVPARTDTKWWWNYVRPNALAIEFIKGRLKFGDSKNSAPFPSALIYF